MSDIGLIRGNETSLRKLFSGDTGFYIPNFQRPYTWTESHISRLFETIKTGLIQFSRTEGQYWAFLGSILVLETYEELESKYDIQKSDSPQSVNALIDGQQRITSLILLTGEIYKELLELKKDLEKENIKYNYKDSLEKALQDCRKILFIENDSSNIRENRYLPRIIFGIHSDKWSLKKVGTYKSPVSSYLYQLGNSISKVEVPEEIETITKEMKSALRNFIESDHFDSEISQIIKNDSKLNIASAVRDYDRLFDKKDKVNEKLRKLQYLNILNQFIQNRVYLIKVAVAKQYLVFNIFETMNSTGDLLTAFEIFRPAVISYLKNYEKSEEKEYLSYFSEYIKKYKGASRHKKTQDFFISFALFEKFEGKDEIPVSLESQRKYLLEDTYKEYSESEKKQLCKSIYHLTSFYKEIWDKGTGTLSGHYSSECKLGLSVLKDTRHTVTIPLLARYYSVLGLDEKPEDKKLYNHFNSIVKQTVAFSLFWRMLHNGSTAGIDDVYRVLMEECISRKNKNIDILKFKLNEYFKEKMQVEKLLVSKEKAKDRFVKIVSQAQYSSTGNNRWLKFFMLAALHDTTVDGTSGLDTAAAKKFSPKLNYDTWASADKLTIEHIAPQNPPEGSKWETQLLNPEISNSIGNLTLLPQISNSIAGNKEWKDKKDLYKILSIEDKAKRIKMADEKLKGLSQKSKKYLKASDYWSAVKALSECKQVWNHKLVRERAKRLAELAWDNLSPWLGY